MKNKLREYLLRAGDDLGITVIAPFALELKSGSELSAEALLPEFGAPNGTIVCRSPNSYMTVMDELKNEGYTCTSFDDPLPKEEYDLESYKEMLIDWGWTSKARSEPSWMKIGRTKDVEA